PNARIGALLRQGFVLHWQSERPAPRITIDFGDGRKMERTLTGNSVHYVLDEEGNPVDALPGLYGPEAFARGLVTAREVALGAIRCQGDERQVYLRSWHRRTLLAMEVTWAVEVRDLGAQGVPPPDVIVIESPDLSPKGDPFPSAAAAAPLAPAKMAPERPVV